MRPNTTKQHITMTRFMKMTSLLPQKLVSQTKRLITIASLSLLTLNVSAYDISINGSEYLGLTAILDGSGMPTTSLMEYDYDITPATVSFHVADPLVCASKANSTTPNIITQVQDGNGIEVTTMQNNIITTEYDLDNDQFNITTDNTIACATIADAANNTTVLPHPDVVYQDGFESTASLASNDIQLVLLKVIDSNTVPMVTEPFPATPISVSNNQVVEYQYVINNNSQLSTPLTVDFVEFYSLIASDGPIFDDVQDWTCTVPVGSNAATTCGVVSFGSETVRLDNAVIASGDNLIIYAKREALVDAADIANNLKLDMLASAFVVDAAVTDGYLDNNTTYQQFGSSLVTATQLVMTSQPASSVVSGDSLGSIVVEFQDAGGLVDASNTSSVTIAIGSNPAAGTLSGTITKAAVNGIATFADLSIDLVGTGYTLVANGGGFTAPTSNAIDITPAVASQLAISTQPADTVAGGTINTIVVELQDLNGNLVPSSGSQIQASITPFTGGGALTGTNTVTVSSGVATFNALSINATGTAYQLRFNSNLGGVPFTDSDPFNITAVPVAANSEYGVSASSETAGTNVTYSAIIKDATGTPVGSGILVSFAMTNTGANTADVNCTTDATGSCSVDTSSTLVGSTSVTANISGSNIPTVSAGLSSSTTWVAGAPDASASNFWSDTSTANTSTNVNLIAEVKDQYGNPVSGVPITFELSDASGANTPNFVGCGSTTDVAGLCSAVVTSTSTGTTTVTGAGSGFPPFSITNPTPPGGFGRVITWQ